MSWINLYLNALDEKGQPIYDAEKKSLLDMVEFHESDLLSYCRDNDIQLERIVANASIPATDPLSACPETTSCSSRKSNRGPRFWMP
ncbi:hypothetical protein PS2_032092 [Malus domestica]